MGWWEWTKGTDFTAYAVCLVAARRLAEVGLICVFYCMGRGAGGGGGWELHDAPHVRLYNYTYLDRLHVYNMHQGLPEEVFLNSKKMYVVCIK